jgi:class 3 adenylate cyclase/tetratricopeptide (TPR) repeat protein
MTDVCTWLQSIGLGEYAEAFARNQIDADVLPHLTERDLNDLGLPVGPRRRLLVAIRALAETASRATPAAERRHITVLFCDLVGSTALSNQLDAEDLRAVIQTYRRAGGVAVERYGGYVAQYLGDGLMSYFGWPTAHEDDAHRAILAALGIIDSLRLLKAPVTLQVRIGIASGQVVVGDAGDSDVSLPTLAIGETPNLAARLQTLAGPDQIVIASSTRRLVGAAFELRDLGAQTLKGIAQGMHVWRVIGLAQANGRFEASHAGRLTPFVGRAPELAALLDRWERARRGDGQAALLSGEAGIGKSRLAQVLAERVGTHTRHLRYQCSPSHTNSALYPVIEHLQRAARFDRNDEPRAKLDKLEGMLAAKLKDAAAAAPLFATLLSIDSGDRYPPSALGPQAHKEALLRAIANYVLAAPSQPLLVMVEDAHWTDPTTQELLDLLLQRLPSQHVMLLITCRPEYEPRWVAQDNRLTLVLSRMPRQESLSIVREVGGSDKLPLEVSEQILAKTEGVPLFLEEVTKAVVEGAFREGAAHTSREARFPQQIAVPSTLQDSLMARLDRAGAIREVAQMAACIGRQFSRDLLAAVAPIKEQALDDALQQLVEAGVISRADAPSSLGFAFKHALLQDAAYSSLLRSRRQTIHGRIADTLLQDFPETVNSAAETIAHHYTEAGNFELAVGFWRAAAERASASFANREAIAHAHRGLQVLERLPQGDKRVDAELALRMTVAACLRMLDRHDAALEELERALALAEKHAHPLMLARLHHLRGNIYFPMGEVNRCLAEHQAASQFARQAGSTEEEARALGGVGDAHYMAGRLMLAHQQFDRCVALCRAHGLEAIERAYLPMRATTYMYLLRFSAALKDCHDANHLFARAGHTRGEILSRNISSWITLEQLDLERAERDARRGLEVVEQLGARRFAPLFDYIIARILLHRGEPEAAVTLLERSWATAVDTGATFIGPFVLGLLALASVDTRRRSQALHEGQTVLDRGCVSHNYFWFYRHAIDVCLDAGDWDAADRYAHSLEERFREDAHPWAEFVTAQGRALATLGRTGHGREIDSRLSALSSRAEALGLRLERVRLQAVLVS